MSEFEQYQSEVRWRIGRMENMLWDAQLMVYPDSVRVSFRDTFDWITDDSGLEAAVEYWDKRWGRYVTSRLEYLQAKSDFVDKWRGDNRLGVSRSLNLCLQYAAGVFYTCHDGKSRGFRFGLDDSDYISGFGKFL